MQIFRTVEHTLFIQFVHGRMGKNQNQNEKNNKYFPMPNGSEEKKLLNKFPVNKLSETLPKD